MAKQTLPTNFIDDIFAPSMGGKRKFTITDNGDGTYEIEDVTDYTQTGSDFGAGQINATNQAVNESCDKANVIETMDDIMANQASGMIAGAKAVAELNGNKISKYDVSTDPGEILTGETFASKPIYMRLVDIGVLPNNTSKTINTGITNADYFWIDPTYSMAIAGGAGYPLPYVDPENIANSIAVRLIAHGQQVVVTTEANWSTYAGFVAVRYTKQ